MGAKASVKLEIKGARNVLARMAEAGERGKKAAGAGLYLVGSDVMTDAKRRTPVDLGPLRNSGYVTLPEPNGKKLVVEMGFGGPAKDYAVVQHEDQSLIHEVGEAKFLENAINAQSAAIVSNLRSYTMAAFKAGAGASKGPLPTDPNAGGS